ncbi:ribosome-associated translation inhibitor RaiA [Candidatus Saccharibacteria bacterium]|nr:ribosome-associated translation inhibitor RaiA [Candidatus Saccharibacteria bacterium]
MSNKGLNIEITGIHLEVDKKSRNYIRKKMTKLVDYIPRKARDVAFAAIRIEQINQKNNNKYECEVVLTLPDKKLVAGDAAPNVLAAIDIVEAKLRSQIRRYKTERTENVRRGGIVARAKNVLLRRKNR